jgi:hypothetical protein
MMSKDTQAASALRSPRRTRQGPRPRFAFPCRASLGPASMGWRRCRLLRPHPNSGMPQASVVMSVRASADVLFRGSALSRTRLGLLGQRAPNRKRRTLGSRRRSSRVVAATAEVLLSEVLGNVSESAGEAVACRSGILQAARALRVQAAREITGTVAVALGCVETRPRPCRERVAAALRNHRGRRDSPCRRLNTWIHACPFSRFHYVRKSKLDEATARPRLPAVASRRCSMPWRRVE